MTERTGALLPELFLLGGAVGLLLLGLFLPRRRQWVVVVGSATVLGAALVASVYAATRPDEAVFDFSYSVDTGLHAGRVIVLASTLLVLCLAAPAWRHDPRETEHHVLILLAALGTIVLCGASDTMLLVAGYLLASVPLYALVGLGRDRAGTEAALKYYLVGALLGVVMLFGVLALFAAGGATAYGELARGLATGPRTVTAIGTVSLLAGLLFKLGAVPAQFWVPDVTAGARLPVGALVTTVPKIGGLVATYRFCSQVVPEAQVDWRLLIALVAAATMTLGNLAALGQDDVRRLLAYSTISQVGYLLLPVVVAGRSEQALPALLFYAGAYAVSNLGAFAVVAAVPGARSLSDFAGLARRRPALVVALGACLFGLVGIPPTSVFVGKLGVFSAVIDGGWAWLAVLAAVNTVVSVVYYLRWLGPAVRGAGGSGARRPSALPSLAAGAAAVTSVALGVGAGPALAAVRGALLGP